MHDATLVYFFRDNGTSRDVCLGLKKKSLKNFGVRKWNGFGGSVEEGEGRRACACREVKEEAAVTIVPEHLELVGKLTFLFPDVDPSEDWDQVVYVYSAKTFQGDPSETEEMIPGWFPVAKEKLPWEEMWVTDELWVWEVFGGAKVLGTVEFKGRGETARKHDIKFVASID